MNEDADIPGFVQTYGPNIPVGKVDRLAAGSYMHLSPVVRSYVPFLLFIDRKGMIRAQYTGSDDFFKNETVLAQNIREEALKLLAESATPAKAKGKR